MPLKPIYQEITAGEIDLEDRTFDLTPPGLEPALPGTIFPAATLALLHPPLLLAAPGRKMPAITGRGILSALSPGAAVGCLVLPAETSRGTILDLALAAILSRRPATPLEQANCWRKAEEWLGSAETRRRFGPYLELSRRYPPPRLTRLLELPEDQAAALQAGRLELGTAFHLLDQDRESRALLFRVIERLRLSSSNQKKLLEICLDLAGRDGTAIAELLTRPAALEILGETLVNPPRQAARMLTWLEELRRPRLTAARRELQAFKASLSLPAGVSLEPSPSFEQDTLRLTVEFRNRAELVKSWSALRKTLPGQDR
jgi:ParB family chromosome partitioning protein